ncbi:hypothetical protein KY318_02565, partial [Candidatus Woesearchaeota archaeon]|nr:hypothetical protein [Candidatus Woesearchaeota archaeon]
MKNYLSRGGKRGGVSLDETIGKVEGDKLEGIVAGMRHKSRLLASGFVLGIGGQELNKLLLPPDNITMYA